MDAVAGYDPMRDAGACVYDAALAGRALSFFPECLRHIEGEKAGQPFVLESWQRAIVGNLFGWVQPDGTRRYREAFVLVGRKNGKTPLAAGIALYLFLCDGEPGPQVYCAAADKAQAALLFRHARGMAEQEPELRSRLKVYTSYKSMETGGGIGVLRALSHEAYTKHGLNISGCIVDELHAHPDGELVDTLTTGTGARRQPLIVHITTADYWRESVCNRKYEYACKVRDGIIADPAFLPVVYEAQDSDDWTSPATWRKANPNMGVSISEEYLARECERAKNEPSYQNVFKRLHLNIRTNAETQWLDSSKWSGCDSSPVPEDLAGALCYGGLDLSSTTDLTSFALWFPEQKRALWWYWMPRATALKAERRDRVPYSAWTREGFIEQTDGDVIDYVHVGDRVLELCKTYTPVDVAFDPWNARATALRLIGEGVAMVEMRQGFISLNEPSKELERLVVSGQLCHGGNPVSAWCAVNCMVETDARENIKPSKRKSTGRIDGIAALVMAMGRAMAQPAPSVSSYEDGRTILC